MKKLLFTMISKNTVNQLNHDFVINNEQLRTLAQEARSVIGKFSNLSIKWFLEERI